jgi:hypothetical protein
MSVVPVAVEMPTVSTATEATYAYQTRGTNMSETYYCDHCGNHSNAFWAAVTPGLVDTLIKFKGAVLAKNRNSIHLQKDADLTYSQRANFSKLRQLGMVAQDEGAGAGYWLLTHRGSEFLKGNMRVPERVKTVNNRIVERSEEYVSIRDVKGTVPYFWSEQFTERLPIETNQTGLAL